MSWRGYATTTILDIYNNPLLSITTRLPPNLSRYTLLFARPARIVGEPCRRRRRLVWTTPRRRRFALPSSLPDLDFRFIIFSLVFSLGLLVLFFAFGLTSPLPVGGAGRPDSLPIPILRNTARHDAPSILQSNNRRSPVYTLSTTTTVSVVSRRTRRAVRDCVATAAIHYTPFDKKPPHPSHVHAYANQPITHTHNTHLNAKTRRAPRLSVDDTLHPYHAPGVFHNQWKTA